MRNISGFDGILVVLPLSGFIRQGKGDDVVVAIDHEMDSKFGHLGFGNNRNAYAAACRLAETLNNGEPVMIGVVDPKSGINKVLTKEVIRGGKRHRLAIVFNAEFSHPEEARDGSFCLRMSKRFDPNGRFSERIMYMPGENIVWDVDQLKMLG